MNKTFQSYLDLEVEFNRVVETPVTLEERFSSIRFDLESGGDLLARLTCIAAACQCAAEDLGLCEKPEAK